MKTPFMMKSKIHRLALVAALAAVAALASGCGQQAYTDATGGTTSGGTTTTTGGTTTTTTPTPVATTTTSNSSPTYSYHFQVQGSGTATQVGGGAMKVATDSILTVSITAGEGMPLSGTGYTVGFNCEEFNIKIGNLTKQVFVKKSGYTDWMLQYGYMSYDPCANAPTTWTGDFSATTGVGNEASYAIQISGMQIDNCRLENTPYDGGCGLASLYSNYQADGFIDITTN